MKILVIHRNKSEVNEILSKIQGKKMAIKYHESGLDGLVASREQKFDLIICGEELSVIKGYELVRALRAYSDNRTTPIILLADKVNINPEKLDHALGVTALLAKQDANVQLPIMVEEQLNHWVEIHNNTPGLN